MNVFEDIFNNRSLCEQIAIACIGCVAVIVTFPICVICAVLCYLSVPLVMLLEFILYTSIWRAFSPNSPNKQPRLKAFYQRMAELSAMWTGLSRFVVVICAAMFAGHAATVAYVVDDPLSDDCTCDCLYALQPMDFGKFFVAATLLAFGNVSFLGSWINETGPNRFYLYFMQYTVPIMSLNSHRHNNLSDSFVMHPAVELKVRSSKSDESESERSESDESEEKLNLENKKAFGGWLREYLYFLAVFELVMGLPAIPSLYVLFQFEGIWGLQVYWWIPVLVCVVNLVVFVITDLWLCYRFKRNLTYVSGVKLFGMISN